MLEVTQLSKALQMGLLRQLLESATGSQLQLKVVLRTSGLVQQQAAPIRLLLGLIKSPVGLQGRAYWGFHQPQEQGNSPCRGDPHG